MRLWYNALGIQTGVDIMKYQNADHILPKELVQAIQQYVQGGYLYIPARGGPAISVTGYRMELEKRDAHIYSKHLAGMRSKRLSEKYSLSESSIRRIVLKQRRAYMAMTGKISKILFHWGLQDADVRQIYGTVWQVGGDRVLKVYQAPDILERNLKIMEVLGGMQIPVGKIVIFHPLSDPAVHLAQEAVVPEVNMAFTLLKSDMETGNDFPHRGRGVPDILKLHKTAARQLLRQKIDLCYFLLGLLSEEEKLEITEEQWFSFVGDVFAGYASRLELSPAERAAVPCVMECIELLCAAYFDSIQDVRCAEDACKLFKFVRDRAGKFSVRKKKIAEVDVPVDRLYRKFAVYRRQSGYSGIVLLPGHVLGGMQIPVGKIVPTDDGRQYAAEDGAFYFLSEKLPGIPPPVRIQRHRTPPWTRIASRCFPSSV